LHADEIKATQCFVAFAAIATLTAIWGESTGGIRSTAISRCIARRASKLAAERRQSGDCYEGPFNFLKVTLNPGS
jgi:hypothetical protein